MALPGFLNFLSGSFDPNDPNKRPPALPNPPSPRPLPAPAPTNTLYGRHTGPSLAPRSGRRAELQEMKDAYTATSPGRLKSGLLNALRGGLTGLQQTGDIGGFIGGAGAGGLFGAISPKGARGMEFDQIEKPQILQGWALDDQERAAQMAGEDRALDREYKTAQIANIGRQNLPQAPRPPAPAWKLGRHNASGQFRWFDASAPDAGDYTPHIQQPNQQSRFVVDQTGTYVDVAAETKAGRKVKAFQKPRVGPKPKETPKVASIDDVREAAEQAGISTSRMKAQFIERGYRVVE